MKIIRQKGFTLVESIVVISIIGIISALTLHFVFTPVRSYAVNAARADLVNNAHVALLLMERELRTALPNSVRVRSDGMAIEFIPTIGATRYSTQSGDTLRFDVIDTTFNVLTNVPGVNSTHWMVVYNVGPGTIDSDAYAPVNTTTSNRRAIVSTTPTLWTITSSAALPDITFTPPHRVFAVSQPVMYVCDLTTQTLVRHENYGFNASFTTPVTPSTMLASGVYLCGWQYESNVVAQRSGIVVARLGLQRVTSQGTEQISLVNQVHVENTP